MLAPVILLGFVAIALAAGAPAGGGGVQAAPVTVGYRDHAYRAGPAPTATPSSDPNDGPTAQKPQSKLWFNDGLWWGDLFNPQAGAFHIYRFDWAAQSWSDTGVLIDARPGSHADTLWDGTHLYIATAVEKGSPDHTARVLRYRYDSVSRTYSLDAGFPVTVWSNYVEAIVLDKDTTGAVWITFTADNGAGGRSVYVTHTAADDLTWAAPWVLPFPEAATLTADDISAVVAFRSQIGVMWSNQTDAAMYFATHIDGHPDGEWQRNPALQGPHYADDHINLKSLQADPSGQVFAAVKTSLNDLPTPDPSAPLILLLILDDHGAWSRRTFSRVQDGETRPLVLIDAEHRNLYMFATGPESGGAIYYKSSGLDNITFADGRGALFLQSATDPLINNATSTKQNLSAATGLLVEASDLNSGYYLHNTIALGAGAPTSTPTPSAAPTGYAAQVLADRPVSYWRLGETGGGAAADSAGGSAGSIEAGVTLGVPGALTGDSNTAMAFDGSTGYVGVPDNASLDIPGDLSVEAWARPAALNGTTGTVLHKGLSDTQDTTWQYRLSLTSGNRWKAAIFSGQTSYSVTASNVVPSATRWDHLILVHSGANLIFYVNGAAVGSVAANAALNTGAGLLALGRTGSSAQFYFNGAIDEVAVYNTALSAGRAAAHYTAGVLAPPGTGTATPTPSPTTAPANTPTAPATPTGTPPPSPTRTSTPTTLPAPSSTPPPSASATSTKTVAPSATAAAATPTASATLGVPPTGIATSTATSTATRTATGTPTSTPPPPATATLAPTRTATPVPTAVSTPIAYQSIVLADQPVSYWRLGERSGSAAVDLANGYTGSIRGLVTLGAGGALAGDSDTAMAFDGSSGAITVGSAARLDITGDLALEAWAKPAALSGVERTVLFKGKTGPSPGRQYQLSLNAGNHWQGTVYVGKTAYTLVAPGTPIAGAWDYLALVRSGSALTLYVNGAAVASAPIAGAANTSSGGLSIACAGSGSAASSFFNGALDEVAVYNHTLPAAQVLAHYTKGTNP